MSIILNFRPKQDDLPTDEGSWHSGGQPFELRLLKSEDDVADAMRLRYRAYSSMGYGVERDDGEYRDAFDALASTILLGAYDGGRLVGCVRLCLCQPWQSLATLPCGAYYPALKDVKASVRGSLIEISRLSIEPQLNNTSYRTTLYGFMVRAAYTAARAAGASMILIATRPDWVRFYKYMLAFEQIGEPEFYPPGDFKITLLGGRLEVANARQRLQNRFFAISDQEVADMRFAIAGALPAAKPAGEKVAV